VKFVDETSIFVFGGKGGDGISSFRREKHVPKGGPDGGDGGPGGNIFIRGSNNTNTLLHLRYNRHHRAKPGINGMSKNKHGKSGEDLYIDVPCGTIILDQETKQCLGEIINENDQVLVAKGGKKGLGNCRFVSSVNRTPQKSTKGLVGENKSLKLELKLLADVGLVGFPNAGKSTFLSTITDAKPKIADYPFTTLNPILGVIKTPDFNSFVIADIPGLIEHASEGAGLGIEFLKHIERTNVLLHFIDVSQFPQVDLMENFSVINRELTNYHSELGKKQMILVFTKCDQLSDPDMNKEIQTLFKDIQLPKYFISSITKKGVNNLIMAVDQSVRNSYLSGMLYS